MIDQLIRNASKKNGIKEEIKSENKKQISLGEFIHMYAFVFKQSIAFVYKYSY